jgi:hypothetical protein
VNVSAPGDRLAPHRDTNGRALAQEQGSLSSALPAYPAHKAERMSFVPAPKPPGRLAVWVSSPASSPVFLGVAAASATAWVAATCLLVVATAAGHPLAAAEPGLEAAGLLLPVISAVLGLVWRRSRPQRTGREVARENRKAARARLTAWRYRNPARGRGLMRRTGRTAVGRIWRPRFPALPSPVGRAISVAGSITLCAFCIYAWPIAHGRFPWPDDGNAPTLASQQWTVVFSMIQLYGWCRFACARLNNSRASARLWTRHADRRSEEFTSRGNPGPGSGWSQLPGRAALVTAGGASKAQCSVWPAAGATAWPAARRGLRTVRAARMPAAPQSPAAISDA